MAGAGARVNKSLAGLRVPLIRTGSADSGAASTDPLDG